MPRVRSRNAYPSLSDFDKGRIVGYRNCDLSYHSFKTRVGRDSTNVRRTWNRWIQDGNTESRAGSQLPLITSSRKYRHVTRMALMNRAAASQALSQELGSFARQQVSA
ncbi:HTH_Tnp_Tc3_2 domain-containing protein [Trichonephila clavipes]|nr:HTH_Tnp_Tc3_2 domain-containing protein [Trichonephila clavipes]